MVVLRRGIIGTTEGGYRQVGAVRFVQCCDSQKARNVSNSLGVISRYRQNDTNCLLLEQKPPPLCRTYAMIAGNAERSCRLIIRLGHNGPQTPRIWLCQGTMA